MSRRNSQSRADLMDLIAAEVVRLMAGFAGVVHDGVTHRCGADGHSLCQMAGCAAVFAPVGRETCRQCRVIVAHGRV